MGEGSLAPAEQRGEHLARLIAVVVDRLLAQDHEAGLFFFGDLGEDLRHGERLDGLVDLDQNAAVGAHGEARAQVSSAFAGPMETTTTSVALPASLRRSASSTAISSKGFIDILTLARSTPEPSGLTLILTL